MKQSFVAIVSILMTGLVGCAGFTGKIENPDQYVKVATGKADVMPSMEQMQGKPAKVVLFDAEDKTKHASFSRMALSMNGAIEKYLALSGAEVVDRTMAKALEKEIGLAEMNGTSNYTGPVVAQYAIKPSIHSAKITYKHSKASTWIDKKGKSHFEPANCKHIGTAKGTLKLYKIPSLQLIKAIPLEGSSSIKTETTHTRCPTTHAQVESLLESASAGSIKKSQAEIQDLLTQNGYISERRRIGDEGEGKGIAITTLGTKLGVKQGDKVEVSQIVNESNELTGKTSTRKYVVAKGIVSSQLGPDESWVVINEGFEKIRIGHLIKVIYNCTLLDKATNPNCMKRVFE